MARLVYTGTNRSTETITVQGILIDPSGANWVCVLQDSAGKIVFSARGSDAVSRYYGPFEDTWVGCNCTTSTNLTTVTIYTR
jgi:hypothetical protein